MQPAFSQSEWTLASRFLEALRALPDVRADWRDSEPSRDPQLTLQVAGKSQILQIEAKKTVFPRDVQQALWRLVATQQKDRDRTDPETRPVLLILAESISSGAKALLREFRVGYYDSGGSLYLPVAGAYIYIDKPQPKALEKSIRSLFSGRRAQVLLALLVQDRAWFGVHELAEKARVSAATASQVLTELENFGWLELRGKGPGKQRFLREPSALLEAWESQLSSAQEFKWRRYYIPALRSDVLLQHLGAVLAEHKAGYAISFEAAAQCYTPYLSSVSQVRMRLLRSGHSEAALSALGARPVEEGPNLLVLDAESDGELLFGRDVYGVMLAHPVQVYLDLLRGEGRAKEMAAHLRKEMIRF